MKKDQSQTKYDEIFQEIRKEKMNWSFEDFLQKVESEEPQSQETPIIPLEKKKTFSPKWVWMAAGLIMLFSIGFIFNDYQNSDKADNEKLVKDEVLRQKSSFIEENNDHQEQVAINHTDSIPEAKKDSIFQENRVADKDVLDAILPKRGRLKKEAKPRFVNNTSFNNNKASQDSTGYRNSYVIVNGKRIDNVEEAINVTKYSFQIFANNVSEKLVQTKVVDDDY
jgi:hypothetical protein